MLCLRFDWISLLFIYSKIFKQCWLLPAWCEREIGSIDTVFDSIYSFYIFTTPSVFDDEE
jgi:hypothetical protein